MTPEDITMIQDSWRRVEPVKDVAAELFYTKLFELDPALQSLFCDDLRARHRRFTVLVAATVRGLTRADVLLPAVRELGIRHPLISEVEEHHANIGTALLWTLAKALRSDFTPPVKSAWIRAYGMLSQTMRDAVRTPQAA